MEILNRLSHVRIVIFSTERVRYLERKKTTLFKDFLEMSSIHSPRSALYSSFPFAGELKQVVTCYHQVESAEDA